MQKSSGIGGKMQKRKGGVTAAKGYYAAAAEAGIKYSGRNDMALIYSEVPCLAAGMFTSNIVKAAPVQFDRKQIDSFPYARAIIVNSGIANACTGSDGLDVCRIEARSASKALGINENEVLLGSTGVIGMQLPVEKLEAGIMALAAAKDHSAKAGTAAERAIMTTDTVPKECAYTFTIDGNGADAPEVTVTLGGMSKGSGMIHPNMCTMLCYVTTDVAITKELLDEAVRSVVPDTFNMISVDGDTSTNDTIICLANGLAGNPVINEKNGDYEQFVEALKALCADLARKMASDGEGASKLIETHVVNADTKENARKLAKSVIGSNLVKAAVFGKDANWGRIICALGYSGVDFDPEKVDLYYVSEDGEKSILVCSQGADSPYSEDKATQLLSGKVVTILCDMNSGSESATAWGCDLTYDYVKINADYRS